MIKWFMFFISVFITSLNAELMEPYSINALSGNGSSDVTGRAVVIDSESDVYYTGTFKGTATFGETELTSSGNIDLYLTKTDSSGNFIWTVSANGIQDVISKKMVVDVDDNIYITGNFKGIANFGDKTIESNGSQDAFLAKYDSNGNCIWAVNAGSLDSDYGQNLATDAAGNIVLIGNFQETIDFGNSVTLTSTAFQEAFVALYDTDGICQWASQISGDEFDFSSNNAIDISQNSIYITGTFVGEADFGNSIVLNSISNNDIFTANYNSSGVCQWAKRFSGTESSDFSFVYDLVADEESNLYLCGIYTGTFEPDETISFTSNGDEDFFLMKLDSDGNFLWCNSYGSSAYDDAFALTLGDFLFVTGTFSNTLEFSSEAAITSNGSRDIYMAVFNLSGEFQGAFNTGSTGKEYVYSITSDENNLGYVTGGYEADIDFGNGLTLNNSGGIDAYFTKLNMLPVIIKTIDFNLSEGWNYISANVIPDDADVTSVFSEIDDNIVIVKDNMNNIYIPSFGVNTINNIAPDKIYSVYCTENSQFSITGEQVLPEDYTFNLNEGWNFIPYLRNSSMTPDNVLNTIADDVVILIDDSGNIFIPGLFDTLGNMEIGKGYKIYLKNQVTFQFPEN